MSAERFDLYDALWLFCSRYHSGQGSRGYRILSRLRSRGYSPGSGIQAGRMDANQAEIYRALWRGYRRAL